MKRYILVLLSGIGACLITASCTKTDTAGGDHTIPTQSLANNLQNNYSFSLFNYALKKTGLRHLLSGASNYTLLVPDDNAFARDSILRTSDLDKMDTSSLREWISYHILPGSVTTASVAQAVNNPYRSISGQTLYFSRPVPGSLQTQANIDQTLHINGDTVGTVDITASDGVIQVLNRPLKLPVSSVQTYLAVDTQYSYFVSALKRFGLWDQLTGPGPFTIWAPDNNSFTAMGITQDSLNHLDTVHFHTSLFGVYVLTPARVFLTDFYDIGQGTGYVSQIFFTTNGPYYWVQQGNGPGTLEDYISFNNYLQTTWTDPDRIAVNGVVQGIDGLLMIPQQAQK